MFEEMITLTIASFRGKTKATGLGMVIKPSHMVMLVVGVALLSVGATLAITSHTHNEEVSSNPPLIFPTETPSPQSTEVVPYSPTTQYQPAYQPPTSTYKPPSQYSQRDFYLQQADYYQRQANDFLSAAQLWQNNDSELGQEWYQRNMQDYMYYQNKANEYMLKALQE